MLSAALAALAVRGVGAAGGAWRRAVEARGLRHSQDISRAFSLDDCAAPVPGSQCARDVDYAMSHIKKHPDWYVNLHANDNPKAFQMFLHQQTVEGGKRRCPRPCNWHGQTPQQQLHQDAQLHSAGCHTAVAGESCHNHVQYTMKENLPKHPEWYPGLTQDSSFKVVQAYLQHQGVCPKPCGLKELEQIKKAKKEEEVEGEEEDSSHGKSCHTAEAGEACYGDVFFAMNKLKEGMHNEWYDGKLDEYSSFEEIQAYLHLQHTSDPSRLCPRPCNEEAIANITERGNEKCHTARKGDGCWKAAEWVVKVGVKRKPEWYEGANISVASTFEHVQNRLASEKDEDRACRAPACPCQTAKKGDECWNSIMWVMHVGLVNHSSWYKDILPDLTFEQIQTRLHKDKHTKCQLPCLFAPWWEKPEERTRVLAD